MHEIKKLISAILNNIPFLLVLILVLIILAVFVTLGLEIFKAIVFALQKYWYATILCAVVIIYILNKSDGGK